jgi:Ca2+-binding RTX toxin-like protein
VLNGGTGQDTLTGGVGVDQFDFNRPADTGLHSTLRDIILDFSRTERDNRTSSSGGTLGFTGAGQIRAVDLGSTVILEGSTDADLAAEFAIEVQNFTGTFLRGDFLGVL